MTALIGQARCAGTNLGEVERGGRPTPQPGGPPLGVVGAVLAPTLAAVGAVAALIGEATVVVEKKAEE